jgi:hypothetical protein
MKKTLRKFFVPHEGNGYHPHILHAKRAVGYGAFFLGLKALAVAFAVLLPAQAFLTPDVLVGQKQRIIELVNELRGENGLKPLAHAAKLISSADARAADMVENQYFSHQGPDGHNLTYFLNKAGYDYYVAGENLAMGFTDAQDVVAAWVKSPTHYANLVDANYSEEGLGLASGDYLGAPTVFVAEHFGLPKTAVAKPETGKAPSALSVAVVNEQSAVRWSDKDSRTKVDARITTTGPVKAATAEVGGFEVKLVQTAPNQFEGSATIPEKSNDVFKVVTPPTVTLIAQDGTKAAAPVAWEKPKLVSQTPWQRYLQANSWLGKNIPLFTIIEAIYLLAAVFFSVCLVIHIYFEATRKLKHKWPIWAQSFGFISLIIVLFIT